MQNIPKKIKIPFKALTINQLWKDVLKATNEKGMETHILVDPGNKAYQSYKEGLYNQQTQ